MSMGTTGNNRMQLSQNSSMSCRKEAENRKDPFAGQW